jgi:hypothetical protein
MYALHFPDLTPTPRFHMSRLTVFIFGMSLEYSNGGYLLSETRSLADQIESQLPGITMNRFGPAGQWLKITR